MAVPKRKTSKSRTRMRNSMNSKLKMPAMAKCGNCLQYCKPHFVCKSCGYYKGQLIIEN